MTTVFDILTLAIFAGLIVLFLQRSVGPAQSEDRGDRLWQYLVAACGCAAANFAGNEGYVPLAVILVVATLAFIYYVLRPFPNLPFR